MSNRPTPTRRLLASLIMVTLAVVGVVVPTLDRLDRADRPVLESEHDNSTCLAFHHDHSICTQVGANAAAVADSAPGARDGFVHRILVVATAPQPRDWNVLVAHPPRAPPART